MIKYDMALIGYITTLENKTGAKVKDAFIDKNEQLVFVVDEGEAGKAIGKNGKNIKILGQKLNKHIKIIEFSSDPVKFVTNAVSPLKPEKISLEDKTINIEANSTQLKAKLIGRDQQNLKALQELVSKYFDFEVKVV